MHKLFAYRNAISIVVEMHKLCAYDATSMNGGNAKIICMKKCYKHSGGSA